MDDVTPADSTPDVTGQPPTPHRFARLARHLASHGDRLSAAQAIADAAVELLGCDFAVLVRRRRDSVEFELPGAGEDAVVATIAGIARDTGEGVGLESMRVQDTVLCNDLTTETRWPAFRRRMLAETPVRSLLAFFLELDDEQFGSLVMYDRRPGWFTDEHVSAAAVYADHATIALSRVLATERADHLERAMQSSREIGQAIGVLMTRYTLHQDAAFDVLKLASQASHRKLRDIATDVVQEGDLPAYVRP